MMRAHDESMLELASLRAIGALESEEAAVIDQHLAECPECRAEFRRAQAVAAALAKSASTPPPAALRDRVLHSAVRIRRIRTWYQDAALPAGLAAAVILIAAGSWLALHRGAPVQQWAGACVAAPDCGYHVTASGGLLRLETHGLPALPAGKVYQAWIIRGSQPPIPEPTFVTTRSGEGAIEMQATHEAGDVVAVTAEPLGGSKSPTSKPVLAATL